MCRDRPHCEPVKCACLCGSSRSRMYPPQRTWKPAGLELRLKMTGQRAPAALAGTGDRGAGPPSPPLSQGRSFDFRATQRVWLCLEDIRWPSRGDLGTSGPLRWPKGRDMLQRTGTGPWEPMGKISGSL